MRLERYPVTLATLKVIVAPTRRNVYLEQIKERMKHLNIRKQKPYNKIATRPNIDKSNFKPEVSLQHDNSAVKGELIT